MRWYERDNCVLETKIIKNIENIENMYKNKNKFFNNNENWAYIYKK
jgi:UDP-N-acetylglucosamine pyrophosphorylase